MAQSREHMKIDEQSKIEEDALLQISTNKAPESVTLFLEIY